jgi:hypothetical protein
MIREKMVRGVLSRRSVSPDGAQTGTIMGRRRRQLEKEHVATSESAGSLE